MKIKNKNKYKNKYRCSICDKMKPNSDQNILKLFNADFDVVVCKNCKSIVHGYFIVSLSAFCNFIK